MHRIGNSRSGKSYVNTVSRSYLINYCTFLFILTIDPNTFSPQAITYNLEPTSSVCLIEHHLCFLHGLGLFAAGYASRLFFDTVSKTWSPYKAETSHRSLTQPVSDMLAA